MDAPDGLLAASETGDELVALRALRRSLAVDLESCDSMRDKAALAQRLMDVLGRISLLEKLQPAKKGTGLDELQRRRREKQAPGPKDSASQ